MHKDTTPPEENTELPNNNNCEEYLNGWKRALADYENLKKQTIKEKEDFARFATLNLIIELLPIYQHLKTSLNFIPENLTDSSWVKGIENIKNQFSKFLKDNNLKEIAPEIGEEFNPELHEAVEHNDHIETNPGAVDNKKEIENKIAKVLSDGYKLHGKVIVPAVVVVK